MIKFLKNPCLMFFSAAIAIYFLFSNRILYSFIAGIIIIVLYFIPEYYSLSNTTGNNINDILNTNANNNTVRNSAGNNHSNENNTASVYSRREYSVSNILKNVPQNLIYDQNTLMNQHCIVRYFENEKIIVIDNPKNKKRSLLRTFKINQTNNINLELYWYDICSIYDESSNLSSLFSFLDNNSGLFNIMFLRETEGEAPVAGMEEFIPKIENKKKIMKTKENSEFNEVVNQPKGKPILIDFADLNEYEPILNNNEENNDNIVELDELEENKKIHVNYADSDTISTLPGINIVKAKKIVEYRDIHGAYKTKEDFFAVANTKEHFIKIISDMISLKDVKPKIKYVAEEDERIVD